MFELRGKYNTAKIYTDNIENGAQSQIIELCNQEFCKDSKIRIMPDVHMGEGCTIGTSMTITNKVVPNLVGVDIGCGMETIKLKNKSIDFEKLDNIIRTKVPSGFDIRETPHKYADNININSLLCKNNINVERAILSIGSCGGGNHFLEIDQDKDGYLYLVIHTGSRNLGKQVAEYYQKIAEKKLLSVGEQKQFLVKKLKSEGREKEIEAELKKIRPPKINKKLAYVYEENFDNYIHDMKITQEFAMWNRKAIADTIITSMNLTPVDQFTTIHNYIDTNDMILRKGAISAKKGEKLLIPINMRDGAIIGIGKGNADWNYSAPHGGGRLLSRSKAKETIKLDEFENSMKGIWTTSVNTSTIDESPMAYKPMDEIMNNIKDTVDIIDVIKPLYNFKAS